MSPGFAHLEGGMARRDTVSEDERERRKAAVEAVASRVYGSSWQTPLATEISDMTGRSLERSRIAGWFLKPAADKPTSSVKPVPAWVMNALPELARRGAARLRHAAEELDLAAAELDRVAAPPEGGEGAPPAPGEPEETPAAPQGPDDYKAADEAFHAWLDSYVEGKGAELGGAP
ncbi:hypothetical protein [Methylobacterium sp.]|uniref:hypothetical protein n=2 Tax=Methylobacterium TaxID=407 RepID=UPI000EE6103F|nr:hypothetical protein [Methylobacterium sp.]GBU19032.1 hypothetical protein AwMethylo_32470 [Methylobacterium sp.]